MGQLTKDAGAQQGMNLMTPVHGDLSSATAVTAAPPTLMKWVLTDIIISTASAAEVHIEEETSGTTVFGPILMPANGYAQFTPRAPLKHSAAAKKFLAHSSDANHVTVQVGGYLEM
jgi:hypothetical protein